MKFALPQFLYAIPVVWGALAFLLWQTRRRRQALLKKFAGDLSFAWTDTGRHAQRQKWDISLLFIIVTALLVALARPLYFYSDERSEMQGASYLIALDVSRSMLAGDMKPSRYAATTNALDKYFAETHADRIGLITFAGIGYLNAPLTYDTRALRTILSYINPAAQLDPGSSMVSAIDRASRYFTSNAIPQRTLILISDGEELDDGRALQLARTLQRDKKMTIHTVGVGTTTGARIPAYRTPNSPAGPISASPEITTRLDENNLRRLARAGGGRYFKLGQNGEGLQQLREEVLRPLAEKIARGDLQNYREGYFVPLSIAVLALLARVLLGAERFARKKHLPSILEANV